MLTDHGRTPRILAQLVLVVVAIVLLAPVGVRADEVTTVILVRHAEKADGGDDPALTPVGEVRANNLAIMLKDVPVGAIYATQFVRTRATAQPLADELGMNVMVFNVTTAEKYVEEMAGLILAKHVGDTVVIVSHSNTVPAIIDALGAGPAPDIAESGYDDLFIVTVSGGGSKMLHLHYGDDVVE